ncbi:MAG: TetR/AcrR family transcriptional regulator [Gammaproteobacteria bacterium]|nr:TetR/AcrR family transcriptional regulator [Gammaproteobacteria bacterium]MCK5262288.1 TetR/AcrR family transcriptional regulator [Gammaproteobacteria bacterium]
MGSKGENNRQLIVEAADQLFYTRGYHQTSFRDISDATGIPRGNFYYYFKTKDDILNAVVESRVEVWGEMLHACEEESTEPRQRLLCFSNMLTKFEDNIVVNGCPIGTLCSELAKDERNLQEVSCAVFSLMRSWLVEQFTALNCPDADDKAMDMLARMQGVTVMASAFGDREFIHRSLSELQVWIVSQTLS